MKPAVARKLVLIATGIMVVVVFIGAAVNLTGKNLPGASAAGPAVQAQAVAVALKDGVDSPLRLKDYCGDPDHVQKTSSGVLVWIYEDPKVLVSFIKQKKGDDHFDLMYNLYDPKAYARWGEAKILDPADAFELIGCKIPSK